MTEIVVREFKYPDDYRSALLVWETMEKGVRVGPSDTLQEIEKKLQRDPNLFLVAEARDQIVGTVIGGFDGRRGTVYHLAVIPSYRNHGVASLLLDELEDRLRMLGCIKSYLLVNPDNVDVFPFYEHRGWQRTENVIFAKEFK